MSLESLPNELILIIASCLPHQVERLAQTYNKRIYEICKPLLVTRFAARRNAATMIRRFGGEHWLREGLPRQWYIAQVYESAELEELHGPFSPHPSPNFDYLDLNGELPWLQPQDHETGKEWARYRRRPAATPSQIEQLVQTADRLGIALPKGFTKFFLDEERQKRASFQSGYCFKLGKSFLKCPSSVDGNAGGYVIPIYQGQKGHYYWGLYLAPGEEKVHCILGSEYISAEVLEEEDDSDLEGESTIVAAKALDPDVGMACLRGDVKLAAPSFEEFLVKVYFGCWCLLSCDKKRDITDSVKEYVLNLTTVGLQQQNN